MHAPGTGVCWRSARIRWRDQIRLEADRRAVPHRRWGML